jgi:hypothetical protein
LSAFNAILITLVEHVQQLAAAHRVFAWSDAVREWGMLDGRRRQDVGTAVNIVGKMVDIPVIRKEQEIFSTAMIHRRFVGWSIGGGAYDG